METPAEDQKKCCACHALLPLDSFYLKAKDSERRDSRCRACRAAEMRRYRAENPEIVKAIERRTRKKHREKYRERSSKWYYENHQRAKDARKAYRIEKAETIRHNKLKAAFGIGLDEYDEMLKSQNGKCAICGVHESRLLRRLAVDHCHNSGKVRGLLCGSCNTGIGSFKESEINLTSAIKYIQKHAK
jgi:hypothetical protein